MKSLEFLTVLNSLFSHKHNLVDNKKDDLTKFLAELISPSIVDVIYDLIGFCFICFTMDNN